MAPLGIGIIGTGNIAGPYASDIATYPHLRLVAVADLDPARAEAFARQHDTRAHATEADLLADPDVDTVVNLTVHHAHYEVTKRALEAGKHVYSEKPLALRTDQARELVELARSMDRRLACSPATLLGEAQQTAAALLRAGRLGTVRAVYAQVDWGRIERWHPAPEPFFGVGVLFDVGVYPLTLVSALVGPARRVSARGWELMPNRVTVDGRPFRIGKPDLIVATVELETGAVLRLTASFYVGRPVRLPGAIEFHGDDASLLLGSFQDFDAAVELGPHAGEYAPVPLVRPAPPKIAWGRGVAELAEGIQAGRPHRASAEQAAHVVEILCAAEASMERDGAPVEVTSDFEAPALLPWAADDR